MSSLTDVLLLVDVLDDTDQVKVFNDWLKKEWSNSQPQFEVTSVAGVFTTSINQAAHGTDIVDTFNRIEWQAGSYAMLMLRPETTECWTTYKWKE
jgi:hypothetical protein